MHHITIEPPDLAGVTMNAVASWHTPDAYLYQYSMGYQPHFTDSNYAAYYSEYYMQFPQTTCEVNPWTSDQAQYATMDSNQTNVTVGDVNNGVFSVPATNVTTNDPNQISPAQESQFQKALTDDINQSVPTTCWETQIAGPFICKICELNCCGSESFQKHTAGQKHCKKYLMKQTELGFELFAMQYGDVPFSKVHPSQPMPNNMDPYALHTFRSGLVNKYSCKACGEKTFQMSKWFEHAYGWKHGEKMRSLELNMSREFYLSQYGDLPKANPKLFPADYDFNSTGLASGMQATLKCQPDELNKSSAVGSQVFNQGNHQMELGESIMPAFDATLYGDGFQYQLAPVATDGERPPEQFHCSQHQSDFPVTNRLSAPCMWKDTVMVQQNTPSTTLHCVPSTLSAAAPISCQYPIENYDCSIATLKAVFKRHLEDASSLHSNGTAMPMPFVDHFGFSSDRFHHSTNSWKLQDEYWNTIKNAGQVILPPTPALTESSQKLPNVRDFMNKRQRLSPASDGSTNAFKQNKSYKQEMKKARRKRSSNSSGSDGQQKSEFRSKSLSSSRRSIGTFSFFKAMSESDLDHKVLKKTLYEFVREIVKKQPRVLSDNRPDDVVFRELSKSDQMNVCRVHAVTGEDSVVRCLGAVKFLRSLDHCLFDVLHSFLESDSQRQLRREQS